MRSLALFFAAAACLAPAQLGLSVDLPTTQVMIPGGYVEYVATVTNLHPAPAAISAFSCGTESLWLTNEPSDTVLPPQASVSFCVLMTIGIDAYPPGWAWATLCATSDLGGSASLTFNMLVETPAPTYTVKQYSLPLGGPGSPTEFSCSFFYSHDYYTVFSLEPAAGGVGTGPYLGLYASDPNFLIGQLFLPDDTPPFRYRGSGGLPNDATLATFTLPAGLTIEWVTIYPRFFGPPGAPPFLWTPAQRYVTY